MGGSGCHATFSLLTQPQILSKQGLEYTTAQNQVMILSGTGNTGLPMVVTYRGLSSIKSKVSEVVRAGEIIGTFGANSTPRAMEQEVLKVEVTIGNKPLPPPEGLRQWPYR